jgi:hypothetical protein
MKRTILTSLMLALLAPVAFNITAVPAQPRRDTVTLQGGKPKAPSPTPKPRKPGPRDEGDGD